MHVKGNQNQNDQLMKSTTVTTSFFGNATKKYHGIIGCSCKCNHTVFFHAISQKSDAHKTQKLPIWSSYFSSCASVLVLLVLVTHIRDLQWCLLSCRAANVSHSSLHICKRCITAACIRSNRPAISLTSAGDYDEIIQ